MGQSGFEFICDTISREAGGTLACDDDKIGGWQKHRAATAKKLADVTLKPVPND